MKKSLGWLLVGVSILLVGCGASHVCPNGATKNTAGNCVLQSPDGVATTADTIADATAEISDSADSTVSDTSPDTSSDSDTNSLDTVPADSRIDTNDT